MWKKVQRSVALDYVFIENKRKFQHLIFNYSAKLSLFCRISVCSKLLQSAHIALASVRDAGQEREMPPHGFRGRERERSGGEKSVPVQPTFQGGYCRLSWKSVRLLLSALGPQDDVILAHG